ncbi:MAG: methyltransferase [Pseudomonadota bacterium]
MEEADRSAPRGLSDTLLAWRNRLAASPRFQRWASRFPLTRMLARRDALRLYDIVAGFVYAQVMRAAVELELLERLQNGPRSVESLALCCGLPVARMETLCQSAAALGLLTRRPDGHYALGRLGAAALGVPGLAAMVRHHDAFYADLADPVALMRGEADPALARTWPYVTDAKGGQGIDAKTAATYSELMRLSQAMVAEETLGAVSLRDTRHLMDVGGGTGAFLTAAARRWPTLQATLFDLPAVVAGAGPRLQAAGLAERIRVLGGSFRDSPLPEGADAISLVRVLYDHDEATVAALLSAARAALPANGLLIVAEPMSGGDRPSRIGDAYFGFYTMAMTTGRPRAPAHHADLLAAAGFVDIRVRRTVRPFIAGVVTARSPDTKRGF